MTYRSHLARNAGLCGVAIVATLVACSVVNAPEDEIVPPDGDGGTGQAGGGTAAEGGVQGGGGHGAQGAQAGSGGSGGVPAGCGDGTIVPPEECDDQNVQPGDGCSAGCTVEDGYQCDGEPSACSTVCGDGIIAGDEDCDDNDAADGDGCSGTCTIEAGYVCGGEPSVCCNNGLEPCAGSCVDTVNDPAHCGSCNDPCSADQFCAQSGCTSACQGGAVLQSVAPSQTIVVCDHPNDAVCEEDMETLCPVGWQLCSYLQHGERNAGWTYPANAPSSIMVGEIYCRLSMSGAGHFTVPDSNGQPTTLGDAMPFNCFYGSSRPSCTASWGCNEQYSQALCCAPTPTCGNGDVDHAEEECDDGNGDEDDDCLNSCSYRQPEAHGITGTNCGG